MSFMNWFSQAVVLAAGGRKRWSDPQRCKEYIEQCREIAASPTKPYRGVRSKISKKEIGGAEVFFLGRSDESCMLYFHGGSYVEQPVMQHWQFCDKVARQTGCMVAFSVYPKAPAHNYREVYDHAVTLYQELLKEYGADHIYIAGDSAGGGLVLGLAQYLKTLGLPQPKRLIMISPWLDASVEFPYPEFYDKRDVVLSTYGLRQAAESYAAGTDLKDPRISPLFGDSSELAPMTVFFGGYERFVEDGRKWLAELKEKGIDVDYRECPKQPHCCVLYPTPEAAKEQKYIIELMKND